MAAQQNGTSPGRPAPRRLPRGRHALPREEVERLQRSRLCLAMAEVMTEKGYVNTSVEDVLRRAGVSRQSFYQVFDSKLGCFMAAFDRAGEMLTARLMKTSGLSAPQVTGDPPDLFERAFTAYLDALTAEWPFTRLFLVEVYAAGPEAVRRRTALQTAIADALADLMGATDPAGRATCQVIVAAVSAMVTGPVAMGDPDGVRAVGPLIIDHVRRLWAAGLFTGNRP
ncbi:MAG TPA: TetR/AcrR family transcriptional regulator [Thermomonospora sp.]|nr:TetR/AcrR family transcriptional regulator [Thermomonospora sp.]